MKGDSNVFEKFKKRSSVRNNLKSPPDIFFQLRFDENGAYIQVIDRKQNDIEADYRYYHGQTRDVLKSIKHIKEKNSFLIDWDKPQERNYLSEYNFLIWQLQKCNNFVNADFTSINFEAGLGQINVNINDGEGKSVISLTHQGQDFQHPAFLDEEHVFVNGRIFEIAPVGENFSNLFLFETELRPDDLEKYLSLLYSYFDNICVKYKDYQLVVGSPRSTEPTMIFEKIAADNSLYLRVSNSLSGFEADFFDSHDLSKVAALNDLEKKIVVSDVVEEDIYPYWCEIRKLLNKHKKALKSEIKSDYFMDEDLFIVEERLAQEFIRQELPHFLTRFSIFGAERLKSYRIRASSPKLNLSLGHGLDFLEGEASLEIEGENIPLFEALNQYRKTSYVQLSDGTQAIVNRAYIDKLERIFKKQKDGVSVSFFDLPIVEELIEEKIAQDSFKRSREIFLGFNKLNEAKSNLPRLKAPLRPYQEQGYKWLNYLHEHSLGGCLADDMGLGKTLEAIALLSGIYPGGKKTSLVVMPKSLLFNWEAEINKFNPNLSYYIYYASNRDLATAKKHNLILTTYGLVRNDIKKFKEEEFYFIILDESQNIKNLDSQISKAVMLLKGKHRLALSGTPIENNLGELYSLFRFLNPAMFGSVGDFNRYYAIPIQQQNNKEVVRELKKKIYPFILRRVKKDVLKDLPDKVEQTQFVEMTSSQKRLYETRRVFYYQTVKEQIGKKGIHRSQFYIFQALSELRQIASIPEAKSDGRVHSPKREVLIENIEDSVANGHKVLVFANFLSAIDYMAEDLDKTGIDYLIMTGATRDRKSLVERFQNDEAVRVFLMTLKTGGVGLNLTAADTIYIFDPWWNKAAENQAIDRTHRIGQDRTVFSYRLITRSTIEEKISKLQEKKSALFENIISTDSASLKSLDETDIEFILG